MNSDQLKWNQIFAAKPMVVPARPSFIANFGIELSAVRILDVASGDGAAALYLAQGGFQVTAADISIVALQRLTQFAKQQQLDIDTIEVDLDAPTPLLALPPFDSIVVYRFKPESQHWPTLVSCLKPGGKLLMATFNRQHHINTGFAARFCLQNNELLTIHPDLTAIRYQSCQYDEGCFDEYVFEKIAR